MKTRQSLSIFILTLSLSLFSCKKESTPRLSGEWISTAIYTKNDAGSFEWVATQRAPQVATFHQDDNRFAFYTDVPGGTGTYQYDRPTATLKLNFESDNSGSVARQEIQNVETISEQELVTVTLTASGELAYKVRYLRKR